MARHGALNWMKLAVPALMLVLLMPSILRAQISSVESSETDGTGASTSIDNSLIPDVTGILPNATTKEGVSTTLKILIIMTVLMIAPSILIMTTSFTRILVVLALLRQALGTQQLPPSQILTGLSLFLTFFVMAPTYEKIYAEAISPWLNDEPGMTQEKALSIVDHHMREFMFAQIQRTENEEDIYLFVEYQRKAPLPTGETLTRDQVNTSALIPAYILSELKTAFVIGFRFYLPFLVIDMVIATVLISMGMLMLPPVMISLPFKLLLFVLADGWHLVITSLLTGFTPAG